MTQVDFHELRAKCLHRATDIVGWLLPDGKREGSEWVSKNPKRADNSLGSFKVNLTTGQWSDFATDERGGDLISLGAYLLSTSQSKAAQTLENHLGLSSTPTEAQTNDRVGRAILPVPDTAPDPEFPTAQGDWRFTQAWHYNDAEGRRLCYRVRYDKEASGEKRVSTWTFREFPDGRRGWTNKGIPKPSPLYGLDRLAREPHMPVLVVEGEKTADAAQRLFPVWVAVTSGSATSATGTDWSPLKDRSVWIWPDNDPPGKAYAASAAQRLRGIAKKVSIVSLPDDLPPKWDLADPLPEGLDPWSLLKAAVEIRGTDNPILPLETHGPFRPLDMAEVLRDSPPPVNWLVKGLIPSGVTGVFAARSNSGKSMTALHLALCLATGKPVLGRQPSGATPRGVVYISMEDDQGELWRRVHRCRDLYKSQQKWTSADELALQANLLPLLPRWESDQAGFSLQRHWRWIGDQANRITNGCALIVVDTLSTMSEGDENAVRDTSAFWNAASSLVAATGATILALHHLAKGNDTNSQKPLLERLHPEAIRGSSGIEGRARFILTMAALSQSEAKGAGLDSTKTQRGDFVALCLAKQSMGAKGETVLLERLSANEPGAGFLIPHAESDRLVSMLLGGNLPVKFNLRDRVLLELGKVGGDIERLDRDEVAERLWPYSKSPSGELSKQLSYLRTDGHLLESRLTPEGQTRYMELSGDSLQSAPHSLFEAECLVTQAIPNGIPDPGTSEWKQSSGLPSFQGPSDTEGRNPGEAPTASSAQGVA